MESTPAVVCTCCGTSFSPRFKFQVEQHAQGIRYFCSSRCRMQALTQAQVPCTVCGTAFTPMRASQVAEGPEGRSYYCAESCRERATAKPVVEPARPARVIAILNQKGGTGKTTTAVSLAAGLAHVGCKTLLVDLDPQGNVGASLGVSSPRSMFHVLHDRISPDACMVPVRDNLEVITSDSGLAAAEIALIRSDDAERTMRLTEAMQAVSGFDYVVLDCAPSLSVLNHNALTYAQEVLIPVSCDYLALVGVKQVLRTLRRVSENTGRPVKIAGVLPTFYDVRSKACVDALGYLRKTFGPKTLPPVRTNTKLAEAPAVKKTIFEYAPDSHGARDYVRVVEWLRAGVGQNHEVTQAA